MESLGEGVSCHTEQRNKWQETQKSLEVGDLVIVMIEVSSPGQWPVA